MPHEKFVLGADKATQEELCHQTLTLIIYYTCTFYHICFLVITQSRIESEYCSIRVKTVYSFGQHLSRILGSGP